MSVITSYIAPLLQQHNCVVIPELGAFVTQTESAKVSIIDKNITPPHKIISFDISRTDDKDILANHIASIENKSIDIVKTQLKQQIAIWKTKLQLGETIEFENVGSLKLDLERNIRFKSIGNFLNSNEFFGLSNIDIKPVVRHEQKEEIIKQIVREDDKGLHVEGYRNSFVKKKSNTIRNWWIAAAAIVVITIAGIGSMFCYEDKFCTMNAASVITFEWLTDLFSTKKHSENLTPKSHSIHPQKIALQKPYYCYLENPSTPYYLITDVQLDFQTAEKRKLKLWKKGFDARLIKEDSTYQIGVFCFAKTDEVQNFQANLDSILHRKTELRKATI